ncbi:MAG: CRISPR-associated endonuclease Cas2 [Thermoplasmata archaeon]
MWVILSYDIDESRVNAVRKTCLPYLRWLQNSVFIGDISKGNLTILLAKLKAIIDPTSDSIEVFIFKTKNESKRISLGITKEFSNII